MHCANCIMNILFQRRRNNEIIPLLSIHINVCHLNIYRYFRLVIDFFKPRVCGLGWFHNGPFQYICTYSQLFQYKTGRVINCRIRSFFIHCTYENSNDMICGGFPLTSCH